MLDFVRVKERSVKRGLIEIYPDFQVCRSRDLMIRGKSFYAIWDEAAGLWSTDEYDVQRLVDADIYEYYKRMPEQEGVVKLRLMSNFSSRSWAEFKNYLKNLSDNAHTLDDKLTFSNTKVKKTDYVSRRLPYPLESGDDSAYDELIGKLYSPDERAKIEWAIGAVVAGEAKDIQKFIVLYGEAGTGKSTVLNIVQKLFPGYYTTFEAKALASNNNAFATEVFKANPLVAIQHDGDLSRIEDNTKLNSIISHEEMTMNEKFKPSYTARTNCFLFMGTNRPVKITDAKSGVIRRLIDVRPTGEKFAPKKYHQLMAKIDMELGAIAQHCLEVYQSMGRDYYSAYRPFEMILKTDVFFNFIEENCETFAQEDGVSLSRGYDMYKAYCDSALVEYKLAKYKFREEMKNYFREFLDVTRVDGRQVRNYYRGFLGEKFGLKVERKEAKPEEKAEPENPEPVLELNETKSLLDEMLAECPAQYANESGTPEKRWASVETKLQDLDTSKLHYVQTNDIHHIVIDFDLRDAAGDKSREMNLRAAAKWPATYAEFSQGGNGVHLHYIYPGDPDTLSPVYAEGIEIKVFKGNASLRRRVSRCNALPVAVFTGSLPTKKVKKVKNFEGIQTERSIRRQIEQNLRKEVHANTKPSMDFIFKIVEDAYNAGVQYDISDLRPALFAFAAGSTNQADQCIKLLKQMHLKGKDGTYEVNVYQVDLGNPYSGPEDGIAFFDVEVFPNLFLVVWKERGADECHRMVNPTSSEVEELMKKRLVGFNCRRYDNHILYGRYLGYSNEKLHQLSRAIIEGGKRMKVTFGEAYDISYTDVYDFSSTKQSLKKFEIELGIHHQELGLPWDQPVPEDKWNLVAEYCENDVRATEAVFEARKGDWVARQILADLAGMNVNSTTNSLTERIIFGSDRNPQSQFNYRFMGVEETEGCDYTQFDSEGRPLFPGYKYEGGKSTYRGEEVGEGGYVYAEPGMYRNVALLDVASMHPSSVIAEKLFGDYYTARFKELLDARIAIKHGEFDRARSMLDGKLAKHLGDHPEKVQKSLTLALKIAINSVYGLTAAKFPNPFRDPRNVDNIVAKRGALFMVNLKHEVQERGFTVAHIKTDSIKIPNATPEIVQFVMNYGKKYGYTFEHEDTYERMCLVNNAVYIAREQDGTWSPTGAQFAHPYVFKTLFSKEKIEFKDLCEAKSVSGEGEIYIVHGEDAEGGTGARKYVYGEDGEDGTGANQAPEGGAQATVKKYVGKTGLFCPVLPDAGGGQLKRIAGEKSSFVTGTSDYLWMESEEVVKRGLQSKIDMQYFYGLVADARGNMAKFGDVDSFLEPASPNRTEGE